MQSWNSLFIRASSVCEQGRRSQIPDSFKRPCLLVLQPRNCSHSRGMIAALQSAQTRVQKALMSNNWNDLNSPFRM
jgi:hypothetical protein